MDFGSAMKKNKPQELKNNRLLANDKNGKPALHLAARHIFWRKFLVVRKETKPT